MGPRKYQSKLREQQTRDTRQRILEGASRITLLNVGQVTHAAVARSAGVSERTVYRYFPSVAELHSAFAKFLEQRFGADYRDDFSIDDLPAMFERWPERIEDSVVEDYLSELQDPPMLAESRRRRYARIEAAVAELLPDATPTQVKQLVLVFGGLMSPEAFRRGKSIFDLDMADVVPGPVWAMRVLIERLREGDAPWK